MGQQTNKKTGASLNQEKKLIQFFFFMCFIYWWRPTIKVCFSTLLWFLLLISFLFLHNNLEFSLFYKIFYFYIIFFFLKRGPLKNGTQYCCFISLCSGPEKIPILKLEILENVPISKPFLPHIYLLSPPCSKPLGDVSELPPCYPSFHKRPRYWNGYQTEVHIFFLLNVLFEFTNRQIVFLGQQCTSSSLWSQKHITTRG